MNDRESTINTLFRHLDTEMIEELKGIALHKLNSDNTLDNNEILNLNHLVNRANYWLDLNDENERLDYESKI